MLALGVIWAVGLAFFAGYVTRAKLDKKYEIQREEQREKDAFMAGYMMRGKEDIQIAKEKLDNEKIG